MYIIWQCPSNLWLKINVDGTFGTDYGHGYFGVVTQDEGRQCITAVARPIPHAGHFSTA